MARWCEGEARRGMEDAPPVCQPVCVSMYMDLCARERVSVCVRVRSLHPTLTIISLALHKVTA